MKRPFVTAVAISLLAWSTTALAQPDNITQAEIAMLPAYCPDTQTFGQGGRRWGDQPYNWSPNAPKWVDMMGKGFFAMHHYCWTLIRLRRAERPGTPPVIQQGHREAALGDIYFVIQNTPSDFIMLPEIYTKRGEVLLLLKRDSEANEAFATARALKPDYWPAYFHWAEYLRQRGQKVKARALVEEGLRQSPGAKPLEQLLVTLGGNPAKVRTAPTPEPATSDASDPALLAPPNSGSSDRPKPASE
jgi:tetratricopeptide (TPR) repeat protein